MFKRSFWLVACALLSACGDSSRVTGSVKFEGVEDASGAVVTLSGQEPVTVVTGADGQFSFEDVDDGAYSLTIEASDTAEQRQVIALVLADGKALELAPVVMTAVGTVSGTARLEGQPAAGIQVAVAGTDVLSVSGPDGSFTLKNAPAGSRTLVATREGYAAATARLDIARGAQSGAHIDVTRGQLASGTVQGTVSFHSGTNASLATVRVLGLDVTTHPDAQGNFSLKVPAGEYDLQAEAPGHPRQTLGRVTVSPGGLSDVGQHFISSYYRLRGGEGVIPHRVVQDVRLASDKQHALVMWAHNSVESYGTGYTYSLYDLAANRDRSFFSVQTDEVDDLDYTLMSRDGRGVALFIDGSITVFDTVAGKMHVVRTANYGPSVTRVAPKTSFAEVQGQSTVLRATGRKAAAKSARTAAVSSEPLFGSLSSGCYDNASFSADGSTFFVVDCSGWLYRLDLATGTVSELEAWWTEQVDAEHYVMYRYDEATERVTALRVGTTGNGEVLLGGIHPGTNYGVYNKHLVAANGCVDATETEAARCTLNVVDAVSGAVKGAGSTVSPEYWLSWMPHEDWMQVIDTPRSFLRISQGARTEWPEGFTSDDIWNLDLSEDGNRASLVKASVDAETGLTEYSLYVSGFPMLSLAEPLAKSPEYSFEREWVTSTRCLVRDWYTGRLFEVKGTAAMAATTLAEDSQWAWFSDGMATWNVGDTQTYAVIGNGAPIALASSSTGETWVENQVQTTGGWTVFDVQNGRHPKLMAYSATGELKEYAPTNYRLTDYYDYRDLRGVVPTGVPMSEEFYADSSVLTYRDFADYAYSAFDVSNGHVRSINEPDIGQGWASFTDEGTPYIASPYFADASIYPSSVAIFVF